ncbi:MAG: nucleotidyltransferase domain-containing protein, partial [Burkholderiaceae bacterium]
MAIPESQLDTWSHQGSITQSSSTYNIVRNALLASDSGYADKSFEVFLQGSYGNDTNVYSESDVDVVIYLDSIFRYDLHSLDAAQEQAYRSSVAPATYSFDTFRT